mmetsp:Transcript_7711/g.14403  ORF Transcript_7711/g.14403 Transcript_7711/m.14403 type:complete len:294 (-) Transcript_7711:29-910(-)
MAALFRTVTFCFAASVHSHLASCDDAGCHDPMQASSMLSMQSLRANSSSILAKTRKDLSDIKILLYVTTHLPEEHLPYLRYCWPSLIANSALLQHADILMFTAKDLPQDVRDVFRNNSLRVEKYENPGYQEGAKLAMEMLTLDSSWYANYDWVIRVNPDVLILDDDWLIQNMLNDDVGGIFVDCATRKKECWQYCIDGTLTNSDFFAVRTMHLHPGQFIDLHNAEGHSCWNAECAVDAAFKDIRISGRDRWIQGTDMGGECRIKGDHVPVLHSHEVVSECPLHKGEPANRNIG